MANFLTGIQMFTMAQFLPEHVQRNISHGGKKVFEKIA